MKIAEIDKGENERQIVTWSQVDGQLRFDGELDLNGVYYPTESSARRAVHSLYYDWKILWLEGR